MSRITQLLAKLGDYKDTHTGTTTNNDDSIFLIHQGEMYVVTAKHVGTCDYIPYVPDDLSLEQYEQFFKDMDKHLE